MTTFGKSMAAAAELFERSTRRYGRPEWEIRETTVGGERVPVHISTVWERPFCRLLHFERAIGRMPHRPQPRLLIVAPMSGHYATLLRGTVEAFLPNHDVYITDWADARLVPVNLGAFEWRRTKPDHALAERQYADLRRSRQMGRARHSAELGGPGLKRRHPRDRGNRQSDADATDMPLADDGDLQWLREHRRRLELPLRRESRPKPSCRLQDAACAL
jgi:hypothetical protein